jgi:hypothetical protein
MNTAKTIFSRLAFYFVSLIFFMTASVYVLDNLLAPENIKSTIKEQGVYDKVVDATLASSSYPEGEQAGNLPTSDEWVRTAAKDAFPATDLETKTNSVIDGVYGWLQGKTEKPVVSLDFADNKNRFATAVGDYAQKRASQLPVCTLQNAPTTLDPYRIECIPPGVDPSFIAASVQNDIISSDTFLPDTTLTWQDIEKSQLSNSIPAEAQPTLNNLPQFYQNFSLLKWLLPLLAILLSIAGVLLANDRRKALSRLGFTYIYASVGIIILLLYMVFSASGLSGLASQNALTRDVINPVIQSFTRQSEVVYAIFAIGGIGIGASLILAKRLIHNNRAIDPANSPQSKINL